MSLPDITSSVTKFKHALINHIDDLYNCNQPWDITMFPYHGRGMIATRDIGENEIIVYDKPLLLGPKLDNLVNLLFCVNCYKILRELITCNFGCGLTICTECANSTLHVAECELINSWKPKKPISEYTALVITSSLTSIRAFMAEKAQFELINMMENHNSDQTDNEVQKIIDVFNNFPTDEATISFLKRIISVLNTNAFAALARSSQSADTSTDGNNNDTTRADSGSQRDFVNLRGLYPMAAVFNHNCIPNIRYTYDDNYIMTVHATRFIRKGEELFNTYSKLLWGTPQRQIYLNHSKKFKCSCSRCQDPTESSTNIAALKCVNIKCTGVLLPIHPLLRTTSWMCTICRLKLGFDKIKTINNILISIITKDTFLNGSVHEILEFLRHKLEKLLPLSNQYAIELKLHAIKRIHNQSMLKEDNSFGLQDFHDKESYCIEILSLIEKLNLGECFIKGILYYELVKCRHNIYENAVMPQNVRDQNFSILMKCWKILGNTVTCPYDLHSICSNYNLNIESVKT